VILRPRVAFSTLEKIPTDFNNPKTMLQETKPDLVVIATWPDSHPEYLGLCISSKIPLVILEKPIAEDLKTSQAMLRDWKNSGQATKVLVNHERRYSRDYQWVKDQLKRYEIGPLLSLRARLYLGKTRPPWKTLLHDGTHLIDAIRFLSPGDFHLATVVGDPRLPGATVIYCGAAGNTPFSLEIGGGRDHMVFEVELNGEKGSLEVGNGQLTWQTSQAARWAEKFRELRPRKVPRLTKTGYFKNMALDALRCLDHPGQQPLSTLEDGFQVISLIENCLALSGLSLESLLVDEKKTGEQTEDPRDHLPQENR
jgi:predicted dehydrogenase